MLDDMLPYKKSYSEKTKELKRIMDFERWFKKGSGIDLFYIMLTIFAIAIVAFIVVKGLILMNSQFTTLPDMPDSAKTFSQGYSDKIIGMFDKLLVFIFFLMCVVALILAVLIPVHWAFAPIFIFIWIFAIILGGYLSNMFETFSTSGPMADVVSNFSMTIFLFQWLPYFIFIVGGILAFMMYKFNVGGQNG